MAGTVSLLSGGTLDAARLGAEALSGWTRYVAVVEARRRSDVMERNRYFVMDTGPDAGAERRELARGEMVVRQMEALDSGGRPLTVAGGMVHHWRGAVLLRGANLTALISALEVGPPRPGGEVLRSAVIAQSPSTLRVYLRLQRTKLVTVVLDTEHDVQFVWHSPTRVSNTSVATRIVEVDNAGTPDERVRPAGDDRGFLWRLNAYWRYEAVPGGVIAECESVSLSRGVPFGLQTIAAPLIGSAARESMERALLGVMDRARGL